MTGKEKKKLAELSKNTKLLYQTLSANIKGQDEAIHYFVQGVFKGEFIPETSSQALNNIFLLSGPPGSGKSRLAYITADVLKREILEVNLDVNAAETFAEDLVNTVSGNKEAGRISRFVEENPRGILLLKNIEKASPKVVSAISQIIETGRVVDKTRNKEISYGDNLIIFTTHVGAELYLNDALGSMLPKSVILGSFAKELEESDFPLLFFYEYFNNESIIFFKDLAVNHLLELMEQGFWDFAGEVKKEYGYDMDLDPDMLNLCLFNQCDMIDANSVLPLSRAFLKNEFYELSRHLDPKALTKIQKINFSVERPEPDSPMATLFSYKEKPQVLLVADQKKYQCLTENDYIDYIFVQNLDEAVKVLSEAYLSFVVVDLMEGVEDRGFNVLSLDDEVSVGLGVFEIIRENLPTLPVYLIKHDNITLADYFTFRQKGARGTVDLSIDSEGAQAEMLLIARDILIQKTYDALQKEDLIVKYNTAQRLSEDGKTAEVIFYDFEFENLKGPDPVDEYLEEYKEPRYFDDIVGGTSAKEDLKYLKEYLVNPEAFVMKYHSVPGGVLLFGSADAGKVSLTRALATESEANLLMITPSRLADLTPEGACELIKDLFEKAVREAPSIILIEKFDLLIKACGLGAVRTIINGIKDIKSCGSPVLFVGTMNWTHSTVSDENSDLDPELLHLLEHKIYVKLPDRDERIAGIKKALENKGITTIPDSIINNIADRVFGHSIADINDFIALATRMALKQQKEVDSDILSDALDELTFGQKHEWEEINYFATAVHEAGHAYLLWLTGEQSSFVTIVGREEYGGYTKPKVNEKISKNYNRQWYIDKIRVSLAGRAAEVVFFGEKEGINAGISGDLENATVHAVLMVNNLGMGRKLRAYIPLETLSVSPAAVAVYEEANEIIQQEYENTLKIIKGGKKAIKALADKLVEKYQLTGPEIDEIFARFKKSKIAE
ncbi:Cell division protein FtsH [Anaerovibrio sp. JC8]|uniref:AAA family ATPase n=1 Tax=Anaerovibrio sp. JC8 TaxID=1240085 RepID=UPI000A0A917B|nr:AAA family ATPase [Anaerovibrio sp. JC8]ORT99642.1 Cell division protein FtsH [Anaerovibrio sp. JC8]